MAAATDILARYDRDSDFTGFNYGVYKILLREIEIKAQFVKVREIELTSRYADKRLIDVIVQLKVDGFSFRKEGNYDLGTEKIFVEF